MTKEHMRTLVSVLLSGLFIGVEVSLSMSLMCLMTANCIQKGPSQASDQAPRLVEMIPRLHEWNCGDDRAMRKRVSKLTERSSDCLYNQRFILSLQRIKALQLTTLPHHKSKLHTIIPPSQSSSTMSFTYNHDDLEVTDSFATPRLPDHDDIEDTQSFEGPVTDPDVPTFVHHVGLGDPIGHMPVSLSQPVYGLSPLANMYQSRCRV